MWAEDGYSMTRNGSCCETSVQKVMALLSGLGAQKNLRLLQAKLTQLPHTTYLAHNNPITLLPHSGQSPQQIFRRSIRIPYLALRIRLPVPTDGYRLVYVRLRHV